MINNFVYMWRYCYDFKTQASKKMFWNAILVNFFVNLALWLLAVLVGDFLLILAVGYGVISLFPTVSIMVRRLHDTDITGFYALIGLIPIAGWVLLILQLTKPTEYNPNEVEEMTSEELKQQAQEQRAKKEAKKNEREAKRKAKQTERENKKNAKINQQQENAKQSIAEDVNNTEQN